MIVLDHTVRTAMKSAGHYILAQQRKDGAIPWYCGNKIDPWNHCEAMMGLTLSGDGEAFANACAWLRATQNEDGSWYACYGIETASMETRKIETNFVAYFATTLFHHFLVTKDRSSVEENFPCVAKAIDFVVGQQRRDGDIQWALSDRETLARDSLLTACSSILRSLECAISLADLIGVEAQRWIEAHGKLADAIKNKPWRFDRTWDSKSRYSMDWFYPILSGVFSADEARLRLQENWDKFIVDELGCRCVCEEPWVTVAESSELIIALVASGNRELAAKMLKQLLRWQDEDGGFWTGYQYENQVIWPREKTTWTAAAFLLACDAVHQLSPAASLFTAPSGLLLFENA